MLVRNIAGKNVAFLGDVHLGRSFKTGVPLDRRGERERMIRDEFFRSLSLTDYDILIQVGDLFDRHRVDLNDALWMADAITATAQGHPDREFVFLAGNHDLSRDTEKASSFELAARLCSGLPNVIFVTKSVYRLGSIALVPWCPTVPAAEMVHVLEGSTLDCVVGHFDHTPIAGDFNLIPLEHLSKITKLIVSGHDHVGRTYEYGDVEVVITGSMQPYSFGEDPEGRMYLTLPLAELEQLAPEIVKDKCVRVLLQEGETLPTDIDCLQLTAKRISAAEEEDLTVDFADGLNMQTLFDEVMAGVDPSVKEQVKVKFEEARIA